MYKSTDTGIPNFLFNTSGGMSMPPVEAPARITIPMAEPIIRPPKIVERATSFVKFPRAGTFSKTPKING